MNKLKSKILIVLCSILTIFLLTILIIFNSIEYKNSYKNTENKILKLSRIEDRFTPFDNNKNNPMFMDLEVYVIQLDNRNNVKKVINYTNDDKTEADIIEIAKSANGKYNIINNLYKDDYIYLINSRNELMIINNQSIKEHLVSSLQISIILFVLLEMIIVYLSYLLTNWIIKPVKESFEKQKRFIYDASHELKTPLSVIMASAETLENDPNPKWLQNIKDESIRMNKLVIDLLDLAKSEEKLEQQVFEEINISKLIEKTTLKFDSLAFENNLSIENNIDNNIMLKCQKDKIEQLVGILIDNAIKHGLEKSKIVVELKNDKNKTILKVINRGEPIPKEERELIFDRFYRIDKSRNRNSNRYGLGLAIAKNITQNHNGTIHVECENGYTSFIVNFRKAN